MKVQYLRSKKPGRALVMASGTPITNTMGELFTVQRFFQPDQLAEDGLDTFDAWANQYGEVVSGFEQNAAGGYEVVSRFAKFQNVPELMRRVRSFMDILTSSSLGELVQRPAVKGGGREIVVTPEPDGYRAYQKTLEARINAIRRRKGPPKKGEDIILNVIADGRFSAIDMRFVDPGAPSDPKSKLNQALDDLIAAYFETADHEYTTGGQVDPIKGSSLILFTDIGLGEQSAKSRGFDMKAWIEKRLTDAGIPREHIAFMRDHKEHAKKERLFADMREGKKRILIGGKDMETGVNVQKRLTHLFHLDAPWFPASVEQREGRIVRQGNQNKEVVIRAYATKGSYDSTMWGMNGRKARFIEQALNGDDSVRSLEDVSEASAFEMAAALASGDERYLKLAGLKADVERLERLAHAHHDDQNKLRRDKLWAESKIERDRALVADLKAAIERRTPIRAGEFAGKVGRATYDKRDEFSNALFERFKELTATETRGEETIGEIGGFPIKFYGGFTQGSGNYYATVEVGVPGDPEPLLSWPLDPQLAVGGLATRAANQVNALDRQLAEAEDRVRTNERRIEQIDQRLGAPFPEQAELLDKMAQLQALEIELTAEKAAEGGQPVSAEAAAATVEAQAGVNLSIDDGIATSDTAAYGPASPEHQRLADTLAGRISRAYGRAIVLDAVAPGSGAVGGRGRELAAVSTVARRLFGHEVVFVRFKGKPLFNGAMSTAIPDVLFINADATKPMMAVLGHELLHHLKRANEGIYNTLNDRLNRLKKNERDYLHRLEVLYGRQGAKAPANWDEELNADIVGDFFMDPEFWAAMAKDQPGLFRRVANAIIKFLDDVAAKIADIRPFGTDQYLTDIAAARAAVVDAMRQFSGAQVGAMTSQSEGINLSVAGLPDPRFSIAPEDADKALDAAAKALDAAPPVPRDDYVGRVVSDLSLGARLIVHPRTIAATFKEFAPVYNTAISQIETRDRHIAELGRGADAYTKLPQESKERVNKVLELGRLTAKTYTEQDLADGVSNPGHKVTVVVGEDGKPRPVREPIKALLTEVGEVVRLTEAEIKAYLDLRGMFDQALDKFRDQTLAEFGFEDLAGQPDAAKAIRGRITKGMDDAERERLENIANFIGEIEQAKRTGYVPFARYGDYVVTVKEKIADLEFVEDDAEHLIVKGVPAAFAGDLAALGATEAKKEGGWRIKKSQRRDVERLAEKTVYSAKVETGLADLIKGRKAGKVDELPAVKAAIEQARKAWVEGHPNRRIVAFRANQKQPDEAVRLSDVDALAEVANIDNATWDAVRDKLATAIQGRSFRKHFFHSDNVPGYTGDFERAIADYVIGMSGYLARREHQKRWDDALDRIPGDMPKLHQYASRYRDYVNSPQEEFAMVRQVGFFSYIAGVAATAFANLTQVPFLTVPTLAQVAPVPLVLKEVGRAYKDAIKMLSRKGGLDLFDPNKAPDDVRAAAQEAWDEGAFVPLETFDLMMMARQRNVGRRRLVKGFNDTTKVVSLFFTFAERLNRLVTFIAAARLSEKRAVQENAKRVLGRDALARSTILRNWTAKNFAEWAVDESQYRMGKANRPTAMRGVGAAIMQFKGFMLQTFEAWYRMAALHGKEGKFAAASSLVMLYAMAGVWGLPGAEDLRKLIEAAYKALTDRDLDLKTELRAWVARTSGSNVLAQAVTKGASYPLGVDMTRVGMGTVFPDSPLAAAGIPFDMLIGRPKRAFEKASTGDHFGAAGELSPNFLKHWLVAGGWATGGVRDKKGDLILPADRLETGDLVMKGLGFQPSIVTDVRDYNYAQYRQETAVDGLKRRFTARIARTLVEMERAGEAGDTKKLEALEAELAGIYDELAEHNESAPPEHQIQLGRRAIANRMMREREGVMARWGKERRAARVAAEELRGVFGLSEEADERGEDDGQE